MGYPKLEMVVTIGAHRNFPKAAPLVFKFRHYSDMEVMLVHSRQHYGGLMVHRSHGPVQLVIFDCDGVLVYSLPILNKALTEMLQENGLDIGIDAVAEKFTGLSNASIVAEAETMLGSKLPGDFISTLEQLEFSDLKATLEPICGVDDAITRIRTNGLQVCVGSSGSIPYIQFVLGITGLIRHFGDYLFSSTQVRQGKPHPDIFVHAAEQMGIPPENTVVVEDSVPGVRAGIAAGMKVFAYGAHGNAPDLHKAGGHIFMNMHELPTILDDLSGCCNSSHT